MNCYISARHLSPKVIAVEAYGDIDFCVAAKLKDYLLVLIDKGYRHILVNLDRLTFIDSNGLGSLISACKKLNELHGSIKLVGANPYLRKILSITGLRRIFELYKDECQAIKSLADQISAEGPGTIEKLLESDGCLQHSAG